MNIGGLVKCSLIDFPGKISAVVFTQGCNFRCPYCHNPELVYPQLYSETLPLNYIIDFLKKRVNQLEGVVISGGEPTLQAGLIPFMKEIKEIGFSVKLDTNGSQPQVLRDIFLNNLVDYVAMDIKSCFAKYDSLSGAKVNIRDIKKSIRMIEASGVSYQFRTTYDLDLLNDNDLEEIRSFLDKPDSLLIQECIKKVDSLVR